MRGRKWVLRRHSYSIHRRRLAIFNRITRIFLIILMNSSSCSCIAIIRNRVWNHPLIVLVVVRLRTTQLIMTETILIKWTLKANLSQTNTMTTNGTKTMIWKSGRHSRLVSQLRPIMILDRVPDLENSSLGSISRQQPPVSPKVSKRRQGSTKCTMSRSCLTLVEVSIIRWVMLIFWWEIRVDWVLLLKWLVIDRAKDILKLDNASRLSFRRFRVRGNLGVLMNIRRISPQIAHKWEIQWAHSFK